MASKPAKDAEAGPWRGDAVGEVPEGAAEAAADRAAGRERVPVGAEGSGGGAEEIERVIRRKMSPSDERENEEEKREAAAEEHARDRAQGTGTAPKNL